MALKRIVFVGMIYVGTLLASCSSSDFAGGSGTEEKQKEARAKPKPKGTPSPETPGNQPTEDKTTDPVLEEKGTIQDFFVGGSSEFFHIGDGWINKGSECYSEITSQSLKGRTFLFSFEITQENVAATISIDKICGISGSSNTVSLLFNGSPLQAEQRLSKNATSAQVGTFTLKRGRYEIAVTSNNIGLLKTDYDDFLVGQVHIKADKNAIKVGTVTAR